MSTIETATGGSRVLHALGSFARARETSILIALVLVIVVATVAQPDASSSARTASATCS